MSKQSLCSLFSVCILAMTLIAPMIPKAYSTAAVGITINITAPGPAPHRNDAAGPWPQGFLMNPASPALPAVPPMVPGLFPLSLAPPWPFAGLIGPAGPQPLFRWSNEGGVVYFGAPPPLFDIYVPMRLWDAVGGGPYVLTRILWGPGVDLGIEGPGPALMRYFWDIDGDLVVESYLRVYVRDPGEVTFEYEGAVGGVVIPINKLALLAPYIGLASTIVVATAATAIYAKRRKKKQ